MSEVNARDCKHGRLARSCEICELEEEVADGDAYRVKLADDLAEMELSRDEYQKAADDLAGKLKVMRDALTVAYTEAKYMSETSSGQLKRVSTRMANMISDAMNKAGASA